VIDAYRLVRQEIGDLQLALVGSRHVPMIGKARRMSGGRRYERHMSQS
jgi:hypothetical protein